MANILLRSPYYSVTNSSVGLSSKLTVNINGVDSYEIIKNNVASPNSVLFEVSELIRDYLDIENADDIDEASLSVQVLLTIRWYDGLNGSGSVLSIQTGGFFGIDGYGYFEDGTNPTTTRGYMQSNNVIYKLRNADLRIPIDAHNTTSAVFLYKGEIQYTKTVTPLSTQVFQFLENTVNGIDSFKERVEIDGGVYEDSICISDFLDGNELFEVDEVRISTTDGLKIIKVITIEECKFEPFKITFVNKWGGLQDLWFFKKSIETLRVKRDSFNASSINQITGNYDVLKHQEQTFNVESTKSITLNTGYVSEEYNAPMQELLQSEQVWMEVDSVIGPVNITDNGFTFKTSVNDRLVDYSLKLSYANNAINNIR
tara:strand:- start:3186 stop:4298 length:1113 start_codon:yes stop_codon:yes gene_type:complete